MTVVFVILLSYLVYAFANEAVQQSIIDQLSTPDYLPLTTPDGTKTPNTETPNLRSTHQIDHQEIHEDQKSNSNEKSNDVIETVYLPQNRIPLRLLQRNRFRPTTTPVPETRKAAENMIMDKTRQYNSGSISIRDTDTTTDASYSRVYVTDSNSIRLPVRKQIDYDISRVRPIARHYEQQSQYGQYRVMQTDGIMNSDTRRSEFQSTPSPGGNQNHSLATLTLPLPVPLENVPFNLRPRQEIQNRLIEAMWQREGRNLTLYLSKLTVNSSSNSTVNITHAPATTTTGTTQAPTTVTPETTATQTVPTALSSVTSTLARSYLAEFMANKNENAREYLRAIFNNQLEEEKQQRGGDEFVQVQQQSDYQYQPVRVRA